MNPRTKKYSVFIVDDDPLIRKSLEIKLKREDQYELSSFPSGEACLAALGESPDLILMDYNMGKEAMNGMEVMLKVKELSPTTDVAILSAQDEIPVAIEIINRGAIQYLSKELKHPLFHSLIFQLSILDSTNQRPHYDALQVFPQL